MGSGLPCNVMSEMWTVWAVCEFPVIVCSCEVLDSCGVGWVLTALSYISCD